MKIYDMKIYDMKQFHRFLHSWEDTEPVPCMHRLLEDEILGYHML